MKPGDLLEPHDVVVIIGKRGSGKSNKAKELLESELAGGRRCVAIEVHDEWSQQGKRSPVRKLGPLAQHTTADEVISDPSRLDRKGLSLAIIVTGNRRERAEQLQELGPIIRSTGRLTLALEEVGAFGHAATEEIEEIATQSRHAQVPVILLAQRAVQIPKTAREQASRVFSGIQTSPDDLKALSKFTGEPFAAQVSRLPRGKLLEWRDQS